MEYGDGREDRTMEDGDGEAVRVVGIAEWQSTNGRRIALQFLNRVVGEGEGGGHGGPS